MSESNPVSTPIVAKAGEYYLRMRYFMMVLLIGFGAYFAYDGWIGYPALNAKHDKLMEEKKQAESIRDDKQVAILLEQLKDIKYHDDLALLLQKILAFALPAVGIALVAWARHNSRGEIRLDGDTLSAPGHPTITMEQIIALDQRLWDRKDIAYINYEAGTAKGQIRLDAFVYQTDPIVKIYDRIEAFMKQEPEHVENQG